MFEIRGEAGKQEIFQQLSKILDLKSSSEQIFSENWRWVPLYFVFEGNFQVQPPPPGGRGAYISRGEK